MYICDQRVNGNELKMATNFYFILLPSKNEIMTPLLECRWTLSTLTKYSKYRLYQYLVRGPMRLVRDTSKSGNCSLEWLSWEATPFNKSNYLEIAIHRESDTSKSLAVPAIPAQAVDM